jgi:hypothetical protein
MQPFPFGYAFPYFPVQLYTPPAPAPAPAPKAALVEDAGIENYDVCGKCGFGGELICCDSCPKAFHLSCLPPRMRDIPEGQWACPHCVSRADRTLDEMRSQLESVEVRFARCVADAIAESDTETLMNLHRLPFCY